MDVSPLAQPQLRTLTKLNLSGNSKLFIGAITQILDQNWNLTSIGLNGIEVGPFQRLGALFNPQLGRPYDLTELDLGNTKLLDINGNKSVDFVMNFPNLTKLNVAGNGIFQIYGLNNALKLTELDLSNNALIDIWPLTSLVAARKISLLDNNMIRCVDLDSLALMLPLAQIQRPLTCASANQPPVASATGPATVAEGSQVVLSGAAYDPDGFIVAFNWLQTSGSAVVLNNAGTTSPSFTAPAVATNTPLSFQLNVTDNLGASSAAIITVTVTNVNQLPTANAGPDQTVNEGVVVTLNGSSADPDGVITGYQWTQIAGPAVALSGATSTTATFSAPQVVTDTVLTFKFAVTDSDGAAAFATTSVTVKNVNQLPTANAGVSQIVNETAIVALAGSGVDTDGVITKYQWTQTAGPAVTLSGANAATATFTAPWVSGDTLLTFHLSVTDNDGAVAISSTTVTVKNVNGVDLIVTTASGSVASVKRGSSFTFTSTTKNAGNRSTSTSTTTGLYLSSDSAITTTDTRVGTVNISSLGAGSSTKNSRTVTVPSSLPPGIYYVGAIADYTKRQTEISETNNSFTGMTIQVTQ